MPQQKVTIPIPKSLKPDDRELLAQAVIDFIVKRTNEDHRDRYGSRFGKYTKKYAEKKGVSRGNVDLELSGEMLSNLKKLTDRAGSITIGYEGDDKLQGKVEGNRKGTYGNKSPVSKPRDFLGISKNALRFILKSFVEEETDGDET